MQVGAEVDDRGGDGDAGLVRGVVEGLVPRGGVPAGELDGYGRVDDGAADQEVADVALVGEGVFARYRAAGHGGPDRSCRKRCAVTREAVSVRLTRRGRGGVRCWWLVRADIVG